MIGGTVAVRALDFAAAARQIGAGQEVRLEAERGDWLVDLPGGGVAVVRGRLSRLFTAIGAESAQVLESHVGWDADVAPGE